MTNLSEPSAQLSQRLTEIAARHCVSIEAVLAILSGMRQTGGTMAQFSHPELGGLGQWSSGMLMIGQLSEPSLKLKVQSLCEELSRLTREVTLNSQSIQLMEQVKLMEPIKPMEGMRPMEPMEPMKPMEGMKPMEPMKPFKEFDNTQWWPTALGTPSSVGSQNQSRYAYFPDTNRLAVEQNSKVTIYDTGAHKLHGASQAQGGSNSLTFASQLGPVSLSELKEVASP